MSEIINIKQKVIIAPLHKEVNNDSKYINILSKIAAATEPVGKARVAAALVYKKEIISFGISRKKTHPFQATYGTNSKAIFLHAETCCILNALRVVSVEELSKCSIYVCRVKYENSSKKKFIFGLAKPCEGCSRAISTYGIKNICYSLDNEGYNII